MDCRIPVYEKGWQLMRKFLRGEYVIKDEQVMPY